MPWRFNPFTGNLDETDIPAFNGEVTLGSAASPSIFFTGDPNTGIYSPGADQLAISTNGTGRLVVNNSGYVGVGNTNPVNLLDVEGITPILRVLANGNTASTINLHSRAGATTVGLADIQCSNVGHLLFSTGTTSATERLRITSDGKLGLGTSVPQATLDLSSGTTSSLRLSNTDTVLDQGQITGQIEFQQSDATAGGTGVSAAIRVRSSIRPDTGTYFGTCADLGFFVSSEPSGSASNNASLEALTIRPGGRVGVGTASPAQKLTVSTGVDTDAGNIEIGLGSVTAGATRQAVITKNTTSPFEMTLKSSSGGTAAPVIFQISGTQEAARFDSSGRLLVGTSSSLNNRVEGGLQVVGTVADSYITATRFSTSVGAPAGLVLGRSKSATKGTNTAVAQDDFLGVVDFSGANGSDYTTAATIAAYVDGAVTGGGANDMPGRLVFSTTSSGLSSPTERMRIDSSGSVLIGVNTKVIAQTTNPYLFFQAQATSTASGLAIESYGNNIATRYHFGFTNPNGVVGYISTNGSATTYATSSDYRLKENVTAVTDGITRLQQLKPSRFNFIADPDTTVDGFLAHEVQAIVPEAITGEKDEVDDEGNPIYQGIDQSKLVPLLTAALQEAVTKIKSLEARLTAAGI